MTRVSLFGRSCLGILLLAISMGIGLAEQTATVITTSDPVSFVKGAGHVTRPVQPSEVFLVISANGDEVTIADPYGFEATLPRGSLKITDVAPPPIATNAVSTTNATPASIEPPTSSTTNTTATIGPDDDEMMRHLNDTLQMALFADTNLWADDVSTVAERLHWPQESKTATDASYRRYALGDSSVSVLGARAYSMALYGRNGHPTYISIVFANKGDLPAMRTIEEKKSHNLPVPPDEMDAALSALNAAVKSDSDTINAKLTDLLGAPETHVFGPTADSREEVHRWDWQGHAILFSAPDNEYAAIKIVPSDVADHFGDVANMDREDIKAALAQRVLKRDNGDVVLQEIPMVDQGPKGYCVPATWERYLRYVDVPADMYVLAMIGGTDVGGGTSPDAIRAGINDYVSSFHRRIEVVDEPLDISHLHSFLDQGLPLMWTCFVEKDVEKKINSHTALRKTVSDWTSYKATLDADDANLVVNPDDARFNGHMRMIIGYNAQTDEFAISDSWGEGFSERWITAKEAQATSLNDLEYVQW